MSDHSWYLNQIGRVPLLTAVQEIELGNAVQAWLNHPDGPDGCPAAIRRRGKRAKDQMVRANLRLVVSIVQKRRAAPDDFMDLVQAGNVGLIRAVELFDPTRGYKFSTYSYWWIKQGIIRHIETATKTIRLPTTEYERLHKIWKATRQLTETLGREPSRLEIAAELEIPVEKLNQILQRTQTCKSLDELVIEDGSTLADMLASDNDTAELDDLQLERLHEGLENLDELSLQVIRRLWGFDGPAEGVKVVAQELGLSIQQVVKLRRTAENRLRLMTMSHRPMPIRHHEPVVVEQQNVLPLAVEERTPGKPQAPRRVRRHRQQVDQLPLLTC